VDYQATLRRHGIRISMSGKGNCYDNAMVETFLKTLKSELVWRTTFFTRAEAERDIAQYIDGFYTPFDAILRSTTSAPHNSKNRRSGEAVPLHFIGASPHPSLKSFAPIAHGGESRCR
jgi:hypothetical protein